ncbi:hypothetical protein [Actinomadura verrucosospora]|uniref:hypothetical protein n=1 Tax=Actinomadura verrucosospora TaxID=46165 RepID=UPI0015666A03|nr:hypothetical protein [Actinomadura verrucosospora]
MNVPDGPAPPAASCGPPPVRPAAGWYAVPVALVVLAAAGLLTALALPRGDADAAAGPAVAGDAAAGLPVRLEEGRTYFLYVRRDGSSPFGCAVVHDGGRSRVRLTRKDSWSADDRPGRRYTASMTAPVSGAAVLTCRGTDGPLLVAPDGTGDFYVGLAFLGALAACVAAAAGFVLTLTRRSRADQRARLGAAGRARRPAAPR